MAKTIMIANEVYNELKTLKRNKSFSEVLKELLHANTERKGSGLRRCFGILKKDKEWMDIERDLKKGWKSWTKRYA